MASRQLDGPGRALVSDDDEFFRIAIGNVLRDRIGFSEVVETNSLKEATEHLDRPTDFAVGLFDLNMKGMDNWGDLAMIRATCPEMRLVVVTGSRDHDDIINALRVGVHGFVNKGLGVNELTSAVKSICQGQVYVPPFLPKGARASEPSDVRPGTAPPPLKAPCAFSGFHQATRSDVAKSNQVPGLTPRQREIIDLLIAGHSNKGMARILDLSEGTIKFHMAGIMRTLGVSNRVEAATYAMTHLLRNDPP